MRNRSAIALVLLTCLAIAGVVLAMTREVGSSSASEPSTGSIRFTPTTDDRVSVVVVGDSITQGDSPAFNVADTGPTSWAHHLDKGTIRLLGGVAEGGLTSAKSLDRRQDGFYADVVVYFLGTNDSRRDVTPKEFMDNISKNAERTVTTDIAGRVVVVAVGPMQGILTDDELNAWNVEVAAEAKKRGFTFVDPWSDLRTKDYEWRSPSLHQDELHPTAKGAQLLGAALSPAIVKAYADHPE